MGRYDSDRTISLWEDSTRKSITLKNRRTGERFSFILIKTKKMVIKNHLFYSYAIQFVSLFLIQTYT